MWTGAIIHQFQILICSSAPEISREVKEVARLVTALHSVTTGLTMDKYSVMVDGISVNTENEIAFEVFKNDFPICFSSPFV